jgi:voltage-gated potassium channel
MWVTPPQPPGTTMTGDVAQTMTSPDGPPPTRKRGGRMETRFRGRAERAIANRRVFRYLALITLTTTLGAGVLVRIIDRRDFHSLGDALWWSLQTLTTVGYGDVVPTSTWGRLVGAAVIVVGITFLSMLTATVTSYFVSADQEKRAVETDSKRATEEGDTRAMLQEVLDRLETIEATLRDRRP